MGEEDWDGYVVGLDGRRYPHTRILERHGRPSREVLIGQSHDLRHDGKTVRDIAATLSLSVGTVHAHLKNWLCDRCSGGPIAAPEHAKAVD
jgi:DNA-binding NarL/FixJ family response regulator